MYVQMTYLLLLTPGSHHVIDHVALIAHPRGIRRNKVDHTYLTSSTMCDEVSPTAQTR